MPRLSEGLVYVDEHLLVLDKPAGLLAVPGRGADKQDCLSARALALWPDALVVHRLDMATSGLFLMARGAAAQRILGGAFADRGVNKRYVAVVAGRVEAEGWQEIDAPLAADWPNRPRQKVAVEGGKPSQTRFRVLDAAGETARLELEPLTGRTHQLRVHLQHLGHPIVGDTLYAPPEIQAQAPRLLLHAWRIAFTHPVTGDALAFESTVPF